ncbi:MAG: dihydroneopterin aldolase [Chitinophagaceae bacterium]|jgi:dihydroneopterin aldolase|nr:dihydroneopterin aldolase [Chitinophagaceae bacterium]
MMDARMTVQVAGFRCRAFHGVYPQEANVGGEFEINLKVTYLVDQNIIDLEQTISYVDLLRILKQQMGRTRPLLETVAMETASEIKQSYPGVVEIDLGIEKLQAPIPGFQGRVGVHYQKKYSLI